MIKANNEFLICIEVNNCSHEICIHKQPHRLVNTNNPHASPYQPNCVKGAFCYYENIPIECIKYVKNGGLNE